MQSHTDLDHPNTDTAATTELIVTPRPRKRKTNPVPAQKDEKLSTTSYIGMNLLRMRSDTSTSFYDDDGELIPLKTAALINPKNVVMQDGKEIELKCDQIPTDRPIEIIEYSATGSPLVGITPGRTVMHRAEKSLLNIFTNNEELTINTITTPLREIKIEEFEQTSAYRAVRKNSQETITKSFHIDAEQLNKVKQGLKSRNQNQVMKAEGEKAEKARATKYATAAAINTNNVPWEWLHKIAFRFIGQEGQHPENLGCGTAYANTDMLITELAIAQLAEKIPEGFTLTVHAHYIPETKLLTKIDYIVSVDGNEFKNTFNAQRPNKPMMVSSAYYNNFFRDIAAGSYKEKDKENLADEFPPLDEKPSATVAKDIGTPPRIIRTRRI